MTVNFTELWSASSSMPSEIDPMVIAPRSADHTDPHPPNRLVPAMTGPAMANRSEVATAGGSVDGEQPGGGEDAADGRHRAGDAEHEDADAPGADPRASRGLRVAADRADVAFEERARAH